MIDLKEKVTKSEKVFRQEIDILKEIEHDNIIKKHNSFESKDRLY